MITKKGMKLFGVPGAGKTTYCLHIIKKIVGHRDIIKEVLEDWDKINFNFYIDQVAFTSFTKASIKSIKEKLEKNNIYIPEDYNFKTLNSLTWKLSEFSPKQIFTEHDKKLFFDNM